MGVYRGGIIDKTKMYDADSRTSLHDFSLWVLHFNLVLGKLRQLPGWDFLRE
jgi:hypothetical protein